MSRSQKVFQPGSGLHKAWNGRMPEGLLRSTSESVTYETGRERLRLENRKARQSVKEAFREGFTEWLIDQETA